MFLTFTPSEMSKIHQALEDEIDQNPNDDELKDIKLKFHWIISDNDLMIKDRIGVELS